jgi:parvulin-like peptidyl-prolyl isomerase
VASAEARVHTALAKAATLLADTRGFGQVAADFSDDQLTRYRGGDAGWFADDGLETRWPKEILTAGFALKNAGEISPVIRGRDGFYAVKKLDARPSIVTPLAQVRSVIERRLVAAKQQAVERELLAAARTAAKVSVNPERLASVAYPAPSQSQAGGLPPALNLN